MSALVSQALNHALHLRLADGDDRTGDADIGKIRRGDIGKDLVSAPNAIVAVFGGGGGDQAQTSGAADDVLAGFLFFLIKALFGAAGEFLAEPLGPEVSAHHIQGDASFSESSRFGFGLEFPQLRVHGGVYFGAVKGEGVLARQRIGGRRGAGGVGGGGLSAGGDDGDCSGAPPCPTIGTPAAMPGGTIRCCEEVASFMGGIGSRGGKVGGVGGWVVGGVGWVFPLPILAYYIIKSTKTENESDKPQKM